VLVPVLLVAASSRHRRRVAVYAALALLIAATLSLPWYGPRLLGLGPQITARSFKQAAESGHPDPFTATALLLYPTWLATQLRIVAAIGKDCRGAGATVGVVRNYNLCSVSNVG